jgi:hypothetical protein
LTLASSPQTINFSPETLRSLFSSSSLTHIVLSEMDFLTKFDPIIKAQENSSRNTWLVTILPGNIELDLAGDETNLNQVEHS